MTKQTKIVIWIASGLLFLGIAVFLERYSSSYDTCPYHPYEEEVPNIILLDMSGSMAIFGKAPVEHLNETINAIWAAQDSIPELRQVITMAVFNCPGSEMMLRILKYAAVRNDDIRITDNQYRPQGMTPLYDAIVATVDSVAYISAFTGTTLMTIITDGLENSSVEHTASDVKALIDSLSKENWTFTFIGMNQVSVRRLSDNQTKKQ